VIKLTKEKIKWHPAFAAAIQLELKDYKEYLDFSIEHGLTDEPLKIDVVVIKKLKDIQIEKSIGRIFSKYNIFEYKSPTDYISIDDYYKVKAYAYLYKVLSEKANSIDIKDITITLTSTRYPRKLVDYLSENEIKVKVHERGIYYIENTDIRTQLVVTKELPDEEMEYLKLLQFEHKNKALLGRWIEEYVNNIKDPLYSIIMDVLTESNPNELLEVYRNMGVAKINEDNRVFLMDVMKKLELDKKLKEEGKIEGKLEGKIEAAKNLLKLGVNVDIIIKATDLEEKVINDLRKEIES
jgi:hypothetical protein